MPCTQVQTSTQGWFGAISYSQTNRTLHSAAALLPLQASCTRVQQLQANRLTYRAAAYSSFPHAIQLSDFNSCCNLHSHNCCCRVVLDLCLCCLKQAKYGYQRIVAVGDGATDMEARQPDAANIFIG
jgi:hypothetical protein